MTDFATGEAEDIEFLAPTIRRIDVPRPKTPRRGRGNALQAYEPFSAPEGTNGATGIGEAGSREASATAPVSTASASLLARRYVQTVTPLIAADIFALALSGLLALASTIALGSFLRPYGSAPSITAYHALALLPLLCAYWYGGLYPGIAIHPVIELQQITKLNTTAFLAVMATLLITGGLHHWGAYFSVTWIVSLATVPLTRAMTRWLCSAGSWWGYPTVVISSGRDAADTVNALLARPQSGLRPCGVIDPAGLSSGSVSGVPYLCHSEDIEPTAAPYAVVALPDMPRENLAEVLEVYRNRFPHLLILSSVSGLPTLWRDPRDCGGGVAGIELRNKLLLPWPRFVKRSTDLALTAAAIVLAMPLLAAIALAIKLASRGPILFGHTRLGRNGRNFTAWKFRTMRPDANAILRQLLDTDPDARDEWEQDHKLRNDPRVTPIGQWLRKTSLDELPQLWNVLTGDMSLVGPRPIVDDEIVRYGEIYRLYAEVPPGITGLWQVSGRNNTTYSERIRLDEFYVRNWSPWLDLHILVRTVKTIVRREGAY